MSNEITESWHIDKKITIGHIITTLVVAISVVTYMSMIERRVAILEEKQLMMREMFAEDLNSIKHHLIRIESKIDGKADKK